MRIVERNSFVRVVVFFIEGHTERNTVCVVLSVSSLDMRFYGFDSIRIVEVVK